MPTAGAERPAQAFGRPERNAEAPVRALAISPDGRNVAAISGEGRLAMWSAESPGELWRTTLRDHSVRPHLWFAANDELLLHVGSRIERRRVYEDRGRIVATITGDVLALNGHVALVTAPSQLGCIDMASGALTMLPLDWAAISRLGGGSGTIVQPIRASIAPSGRYAAVIVSALSVGMSGPEVKSLVALGVELETGRLRQSVVIPTMSRRADEISGNALALDDGRMVLYGNGGPVVYEGGAPVRQLEDPGRRARGVASAIAGPAESVIAAGRFGGARWDLQSGRVVAENRALLATGPLAIVGDRLAAAALHTVSMFSGTSLDRTGGGAAHRGDVRLLAVSPRGRQVFSSDGFTVRAWHAQTGETMWETDGALLDVSPDGSRLLVRLPDTHDDPLAAVTTGEARIAVVDAGAGDRIDAAEPRGLCAARFREDGAVIAVSTSAESARTNVPTRFHFHEGVELREEGAPLLDDALHGMAAMLPLTSRTAELSRDGRSLLVKAGAGLHCYDVPSRSRRWSGNFGSPVLSPDGRFALVTTYGASGMQVVDMASGEERGHVTLESWRAVAWGPGDLVLAMSDGKEPRVLRLDRRQFAGFAQLDPTWIDLEGGRAASNGGAFFPDGTRVVVGEERGTLRLWRVDTF